MSRPTAKTDGGKVALVTGPSGGIGLATATALVEKGYIVFGTSRRAAVGEVVGGVRMIPCDVTSDASSLRRSSLSRRHATGSTFL